MDSEKKNKRLAIGGGVAAVIVAAGLAIGIPAIAQASSPASATVGVDHGANDGETADDQGVEDGTNDGETADD